MPFSFPHTIQTNDFFVSTWDATTDGLVHFRGFPPGLDVDVVIANIQNEMAVALSILLSGRRKLEANESKRHRIRAPEALKKEKSKSKSKSKSGKSQADDDDGEVEIPTADESESYINYTSFTNFELHFSLTDPCKQT